MIYPKLINFAIKTSLNMKRLLVISFACCSLCFSCNRERQTVQPSLMEASKQELAEAIQERDELLVLVKDIAESMEEVKDIENIMVLNSKGHEDTPRDKSFILEDIASVQRVLQQRRIKLNDMEKKLKDSSLYTDELKGVVSALRRQIDGEAKSISRLKAMVSKAEIKIDSLNKKVDSLNSKVEEVSMENEHMATMSKRLEDELNTCYFVAATKEELKKHDILKSSFLQKDKILEGDFDESFFIVNDRRHLDTICLDSHKAKLLTRHPYNSYEIIDKDRNKVLIIINPEKFWSLTNHLVIQLD